MKTIFKIEITSESVDNTDVSVEMNTNYCEVIAQSIVDGMNRYPEFRRAMADVLQNTMNVCKGYS